MELNSCRLKVFLFPCALLTLSFGRSFAEDKTSGTRKPIELQRLKVLHLESTEQEAPQVGSQLVKEHASEEKLPGEDRIAAGHPTMAAQQQSQATSQSAQTAVTSPGMDSAVYVPGSSVENFRLMQSFKVGPILLRPSGRVHYFYESNLVASPAPDTATHAILIEPTLEALIPVTQNGIRLDYTLLYRNYENFDLRHKVAHHFNADSQFDFTPIFNLAVREHFVLSSLESFEFVPGRELIFSDAQFKRNSLSSQINWDMTDNNNLSFRGDWNSVSFDEANSNGVQPFYDYDQYSVGGTYRRDISQRTAVFANGTYLRDVADDPRTVATSTGFETVGGVDSQITPLMSGQLSVGFRSQTFQASRDQNFRGAVLRGSLQKDMTPTIRLGVAGSRSTNISNFERNAYYLTHGIGFTYQHELRPNLLLAVNPGYQRNSYPLELAPRPGISSQNRIDRIYDLTVAARYRLNALLGLELRYDYIRRRSVLPELSFTNYRAGVSLLIGQRGITRGRTPY